MSIFLSTVRTNKYVKKAVQVIKETENLVQLDKKIQDSNKFSDDERKDLLYLLAYEEQKRWFNSYTCGKCNTDHGKKIGCP